MDDAGGRVIVRWNDAGLGGSVVGAAVARPGYGGIVLGAHASLSFDPQAVTSSRPAPRRASPLGDEVKIPPVPPADVARALDVVRPFPCG
jgi:hypothetical protein